MAGATQSRESECLVTVIGGGPAGLMAAEVLAKAGYSVHLYDAMPSVARKFLLAGKGGMNITHSESQDLFRTRYYQASSWVGEWLSGFSSEQLQDWIHELGVDTFVGTSGRVFPTEMKAAPLLRKWVHRLKEQGVQIHSRHCWLGWDATGNHRFQTSDGLMTISSSVTVLALGGASWPKLGSSGEWLEYLPSEEVAPWRPANSGFVCHWSEVLQQRFAGQPVKGVTLTLASDPEPSTRKGEVMLDGEGLEGGLVYAHSARIRDQIEQQGQCQVWLDLTPDRSQEHWQRALSRANSKQSLSNRLRKAGLDSIRVALLRECLSPEQMQQADHVAATLKRYPITFTQTFPIARAISSAGGIKQHALNEDLMLNQRPGVFCAGEMLNWEAPTGGYLLTACFASGLKAGEGAVRWLQKRQ